MNEFVTPGEQYCMRASAPAWPSRSSCHQKALHFAWLLLLSWVCALLTASIVSKPARPALLCGAAPAGTGYLITPQHTNSYDEQALGHYTHINAFLNASQLCAAVDAVLATPFTVRLLGLSCFLQSSQPLYWGS